MEMVGPISFPDLYYFRHQIKFMAVYDYNFFFTQPRRVNIFTENHFQSGHMGTFPLGDWNGFEMHRRFVGSINDWDRCTSLTIP